MFVATLTQHIWVMNQSNARRPGWLVRPSHRKKSENSLIRIKMQRIGIFIFEGCRILPTSGFFEEQKKRKKFILSAILVFRRFPLFDGLFQVRLRDHILHSQWITIKWIGLITRQIIPGHWDNRLFRQHWLTNLNKCLEIVDRSMIDRKSVV